MKEARKVELASINAARTEVTPTAWTVLQQDGPNHLGLWCNVLPDYQMALIAPCLHALQSLSASNAERKANKEKLVADKLAAFGKTPPLPCVSTKALPLPCVSTKALPLPCVSTKALPLPCVSTCVCV